MTSHVAAPEGELPLDYLLRLMRDPATDPRRRDWAAGTAAMYLHPKASGSSALPPRERARVAKLSDDRASRDAWEQTAKIIRAQFGGTKK